MKARGVVLPALVHQTEHDLHTIPSATMPQSKMFRQRDCVENMTRNLLNFVLLYPDGTLRSEAQQQILSHCHPKLSNFYTRFSPSQLVASVNKKTVVDDEEQEGKKTDKELAYEVARAWLDVTEGFSNCGVIYDPLNEREVLTGVDNLLALFAALFPSLNEAFQNGTNDVRGCKSAERAAKLKIWVEFLSSPGVIISIVHPSMKNGHLESTYNDVVLAFSVTDPCNGKRRRERIELLITTEHHCTKHGSDISC